MRPTSFRLSCHCRPSRTSLPRPDLRGRHSEDWDEKVADLQYADAMEYAVGHNISAVAITDQGGPEADTHLPGAHHNVSAVAGTDQRSRCRQVHTAWMPTADVEKVVPDNRAGVELGMEALGGRGVSRGHPRHGRADDCRPTRRGSIAELSAGPE